MTGDPIEDALRARLAEHARRAPDPAGLAEQIIRTAHAGSSEAAADRAWRGRAWALPAIAAASVVAVVAAALGVQRYESRPHTPLASRHVATSTAPATPSASVTPPATIAPVPPAPVPTKASASGSPSTSRAAGLRAVRLLDLTFTGADDGWALASADCLTGPGRCTALLRTTDGRTWQGVQGAAFNVDGVHGCAEPCVQHLRFATDRIGYAYGSGALLMTTDGGVSWQPQPGGADALETSNGNVIRLVSDHSGCPGPCNVRVEVAATGASHWTSVPLAATAVSGGRVELLRSHATATVLVVGGGSAAAPPRARIFVSTDLGNHWAGRADPCATAASPGGAQGAARDAAEGLNGSLTLLCSGSGGRPEWLASSTDGGASFDRQPAVSFASATEPLTIGALTRDTVFAANSSTLRRSADGGRTWQSVADIPGIVTFLGFENDQVGRMLVDGGRSVWTTRDAGRSWSEVAVG